MLLIWSVVLVSLLSGLLQGAKGVDSIAGFEKCDGGYWAIFVIFIVYIAVTAVIGSIIVLKE